MPGGQFQRSIERIAHLAGDALLEGLGDAQALAVTAQRERMAIMAVGLVWQCLDRCLGKLGSLLETREFPGVVVDQVSGVDAQSLDCDRGAQRTESFAAFERSLEVAVVERTPGILQFRRQRRSVQALGSLACAVDQKLGALGIRIGLVVTRMQTRPCLFQSVAGVGKPLGVVRKRDPLR